MDGRLDGAHVHLNLDLVVLAGAAGLRHHEIKEVFVVVFAGVIVRTPCLVHVGVDGPRRHNLAPGGHDVARRRRCDPSAQAPETQPLVGVRGWAKLWPMICRCLSVFLSASVLLGGITLSPAMSTRTALGAPGVSQKSPEMRARIAYAAGEYQEALDIFAGLYAETLHPTYLRNIGRCHQLMGNPDKAISSFQEYLRKGDVDAAERKEVQGFIGEMRELKSQRAQVGGASAGAAGAATAKPNLLPQNAGALAEDGDGQGAPAVVGTRSTDADVHSDDGGGSIWSRWWLWAGVAGVAVAAGTVAAMSGGSSSKPACPAGVTCK